MHAPPSVALVAAPPDGPSWAALCLALVVLIGGRRALKRWNALSPRAASLLAACAAFALSWAYVAHYLHGGPRIIDATSYWLEARALAEGHFTWPIDAPTAAVRGRFLLTSALTAGSTSPAASTGAAPLRIGVIFPPGYPLALAFGFLIGAPMLIGPLIAAATAFATFELGRAIVPENDDVAKLAILFSLVCAALRYHTADTMSHGLCALLGTAALALAFRAATPPDPAIAATPPDPASRGASGSRRHSAIAAACGAGFAWGWLFASRPISAIAFAPALVFISRRAPRRALAAAAAGAVPMIAFFLFEQRAVTGEWLRSSQTAYYALADGPPGCFRLGFGAGIGCLHEHGDFVRARLPDGFGALAATLTTLRRLRQHAADVLNAEPLALLVLAGIALARRHAPLRPLAAVALLLPLAYAPFYFDGNYPAGGARLLADALPVEHVLAAYAAHAAHAAAARAASSARGFGLRRAGLDLPSISLALALGGFALHMSHDHVALGAREGGRPMFEPAVLAAAGVRHGLVFTATDHGFNLAYDPAARDPERSLVVARRNGDDRDRLLWTRLGRPPAFLYRFDVTGQVPPSIVPWPGAEPSEHVTKEPSEPAIDTTADDDGALARSSYRFEAEAEWPPLAQAAGSFEPMYASGTCASGERVLSVRPLAGRAFTGTIEVPIPAVPGDGAARFWVRPRVTIAGTLPIFALLSLRARDDATASKGRTNATWILRNPGPGAFRCVALAPKTVTVEPGARLEVRVEGDGFSIDSIELERAPAEKSR